MVNPSRPLRKRALPEAPLIGSSSAPKKEAIPTAVVIGLVAVLGATAITVTGLVNSGVFNRKEPQISEIQRKYEQVQESRKVYFEKLTRRDTNSHILTNPGWQQMAIAMYAAEIRGEVDQQRSSRETNFYGASSLSLLDRSRANANRLALLAEVGTGATLEYTDAHGKKVREAIPPSGLAAFAYTKLEAVDLAMNLKQLPVGRSLTLTNTEIGNFQDKYSTAQALFFKSQDLGTPLNDLDALKRLETWDKRE